MVAAATRAPAKRRRTARAAGTASGGQPAPPASSASRARSSTSAASAPPTRTRAAAERPPSGNTATRAASMARVSTPPPVFRGREEETAPSPRSSSATARQATAARGAGTARARPPRSARTTSIAPRTAAVAARRLVFAKRVMQSVLAHWESTPGQGCDEVDGSCCSEDVVTNCGKACGEHGNCTDRSGGFTCACAPGFEANPTGDTPNTRCTPPCLAMSNCSHGEYCATDGGCKSCNQASKTKCDAIDGSCCSVDFLASCRENPAVCNGQTASNGTNLTCPPGPCYPANPCGDSTANVCDSLHDQCSEDGNGVDYGPILCSFVAGYTNKVCFKYGPASPRTACQSAADCEQFSSPLYPATCEPVLYSPCVGVPCNVPKSLKNGMVVNGSTSPFPGQPVTFECDDGYELRGLPTVQCKTDGSYVVPACEGRKCTPPLSSDSLSVSGGGGHYPGRKVTFSCKPGYTANEGSKLQANCETTGTYQTPVCSLQKCDPGYEPNEHRTECVQCGTNQYSSSGVACQDCPEQNVINSEKSTCTPCAAGQGPTEDRLNCTTCAGATYSIMGNCTPCAFPNVVDEAHTTCNRCSTGRAPNSGRTACNVCAAGRYSSFGVECQECESPRVV
eukprot:SAG22_NODE_1495_length_4299_cov_2.776667_1_plen_621_part_10